MNQIWLMLGLKPEGFRAGMKQATAETKEFESGWKGLAKIFAAGGFTTLVLGFLRSVVDHARESKDQLDQNTAAVVRFGNSWDSAKKTFMDVAVQGLGTLANWVEKGAIGIASLVYGVDAASDALNEMDDAARRAASGTEELARKVAAAEAALAAGRRSRALSEASASERVVILINEENDIRAQMRAATGDTVKLLELQNALEAKILERNKANAAAAKEETKATEEQARVAKAAAADADAALKAKSAAMQDQLRTQEQINDAAAEEARIREEIAQQAQAAADAEEARRAGISALVYGITNGGYSSAQIQDSSDEALKEIIRRNNDALQGLDPGTAFDVGDSYTITRLQNENARVQKELDLRNGLRNDVSLYGVEGARQKFAGDPLVFDDLVQQFVTGQEKTDVSNRHLDDISRKLDELIPPTRSIGLSLERGVETVIRP